MTVNRIRKLVILDFGVRCLPGHAEILLTGVKDNRFSPLNIFKLIIHNSYIHLSMPKSLTCARELCLPFSKTFLETKTIIKTFFARRRYQKTFFARRSLLRWQSFSNSPKYLYYFFLTSIIFSPASLCRHTLSSWMPAMS